MKLYGQEWKPSLEHPDHLWVSTEGRVMRVSPTRLHPVGYIIPLRTVGLGYLQVCVSINNQIWREYAHRMVLNAFVGPAPHMQADHIDGVKTNNKLENLRWLTRQQNCARRWEHSHGGRGIHSGTAKLNLEKVAWIKTRPKSVAEMAKDLGVCKQTIYNVLNGVSFYA